MKRSLLERLTPMRRYNPKRRARLRERNYGKRAEWIAVTFPCCVCGRQSGPPHHVKTQGAGGTKRDQVPMCAAHHEEIHGTGRHTFAAKYGINLTEVAERVATLYESHVAQAGPDAGTPPHTTPLTDGATGPAPSLDR